MSRRAFVAGSLVVVAAITGALGSQWLAPSSSTAASPTDGVPAVAYLDPALLDALRRAARDAADDGVELVVESGWRSPEHQQELFDDAVAQHGSVEEAAKWVASPTTSAHVSGDAVDVGPSAARWLSEHGAAFGLCQIYANETWHYELRVEAVDRGCPRVYPDPTHDPRMQQ